MGRNKKKERLSKSYNFAVMFPDLAGQWHPTKNGSLKPDKMFPKTSKKIWWMCDKEHEWEAWTQTRILYGDCPYCSNRRVSDEYNLQVLNPVLAAEWHPTKNGDLRPTDVMPGTKKKVWWLCDAGHEWEAQVANRSIGNGCRLCSRKRGSERTNLLKSYPELAKEWHPTKNLGLGPEQVIPSSFESVWWMCKQGHEWKAQVRNRTRKDGSGCPQCNIHRVYGSTFGQEYRELAKEWHPTMNENLHPDDVSPKSNTKVWWICSQGHEWKASVKYRANGGGCPFCSGKKVSRENCLAAKRPELANEWHPAKNGTLTPYDVTANSGKKVWWICSRRHEWEAQINNRANGTGCPKCTPNTSLNEITILCELKSLFKEVHWNKQIDGKEADIFIPEYNVAVEYDGYYWHKDKVNLDLDKTEAFARLGITIFRVREVGLPALSERDIAHAPKERNFRLVRNLLEAMLTHLDLTLSTRQVINCYIERGKLVNGAVYKKMVSNLPGPQPEYSLRTLFPTIALEWDLEKNFPLDPSMFASRSSIKVWWKCQKGHSWKTAISNRTGGSGCPVCSGTKPSSDYNLAIAYPDIARQWHPTRNGDLKPDQILPSSNKKIWWKCEQGHEWGVCPNVRISGTGCPYCSNRAVGSDNNLSVVFPKLANEWHPTKNGDLTPYDVTPGSKKKVWWKCREDHEWSAVVHTRTHGVGCPFCAGRLASKKKNLAVEFPDVAKEWHPSKNGKLTPSDLRSKSSKKVWWMCNKGHEWDARVSDRTHKGSGCPDCTNSRVGVENCLATKAPSLASEWHPTKNGSLRPTDVTLYSHKKVWWLCEKGHAWLAKVQLRARGAGCPACWNQRRRRKAQPH